MHIRPIFHAQSQIIIHVPNVIYSHKVLSGPRSHSIPDVKETLHNGSLLQGCSGLTKSSMHTPAINIAAMDFNAFDFSDDDEDDYYVNDEEFNPPMLPVKAQQY